MSVYLSFPILALLVLRIAIPQYINPSFVLTLFFLHFLLSLYSTSQSADSPGFSMYTDDACTALSEGPLAFSSTCSWDNEDAADDVVWDYSVPVFVNPPPTVSTTALPGSQDMPASNNYFCTAMAPTAKPVFAPTAFPTIAVAAPVSFGVEQVRLCVCIV